MDMFRLEIMRIPFATILFLSSIFMLWTYFGKFDSNDVMGAIGGLVCIGVLVYSMVLYSHMDMHFYRH
jgi:hypothetical protein